MKQNRSRLGLSILAGGLSFVGSANALDLIVNGSFEAAPGTEWKHFGTYTTAYFTGAPIPAEENPGTKYSWRHGSFDGSWANFVTPTNELDHLTYNLQWANSQTVALTNAITGAAVDSGLGRFTFSAWLASYGTPNQNPEQPYLVLRFFNAATNQVGPNVIFDRTTNYLAVTYADGNTFIPEDLSADHSMIKYLTSGTVPNSARWATVYITRSPRAAVSNRPDTYVDLVKLDVININDTTVLESASPANNQNNVSPDSLLTVTLKDVNTQVKSSSIQMTLNGAPLTPTVNKVGLVTTVQATPPALLAPFITNSYKIVWSDTATPANFKTNEFAFTVAPYVNVNLGAPLHLETFNGVAEGSLPAGWSVENYTDLDFVPSMDLNDFHSDAYTNWVVISRDTLNNLMNVVPGGPDMFGTTNVAPGQVINGAVVKNLIETNFIFAVADRGANGGQKQIQYLFSKDFDLTGKANVYLAFNSIYVQNQDSMGSVEYSINGGATWLPALYMLVGSDILRNPDGSINASNTFAARYDDVADLDAGTLNNGFYGRYIGVNSNQWATLSPYLSARTDDDQTANKKIEIIRLPLANNQAAVRLRFAQVGQYSWYWGLDNIGLYSIAAVPAPVVSGGPTPATLTVAAGNAATLTAPAAYGLGLTYQWRKDGQNLPGKTDQSLIFPIAKPGDAGSYDVVVSNGGGSTTSPASAILTVINPAIFVTGQWDFNQGLKATYGSDLEFFDATVAADTTFGTTTSFGIPDINNVPTTVAHILPSTTSAAWGGFRMTHGAAPNGGGAYVNQYTLVYDLYVPSTAATWQSLLQTGVANTSDGDVFFQKNGGIGISSVYNGNVSVDTWHRIAIAFDLAGPGQFPVLTKFIDGVKVGNQTTGLSARDGRFSLDPVALLFADNDGEIAEAYISSVQFSNGRRPDAFLTGLGGPSAAKIPGAIKAQKSGATIQIIWTGGVPLETATSVNGPWTVVNGATSPYTAPASGAFYRPKLF